MKSILKMFLILMMAFFLLGAGLYITLINMGQLLAAGKPEMQYRRLTSGLQIKMGKWHETIVLPAPVQITRRAYQWKIYSRDFTFTVNTKPKFRVLWKKSVHGRRSEPDGEY
jgi:hypothetical protein